MKSYVFPFNLYWLYAAIYLRCTVRRVAQLSNVVEISQETECQENYVLKGIAMACFFYARCLDKQLGIKNCNELAKQYYSRVSHSFLVIDSLKSPR